MINSATMTESGRPPEDVEPDDVEEIDSAGRYVFVSTDDAYEIWGSESDGIVVAAFPMTDEGFVKAEELFDELRVAQSRRRDRLPTVIGVIAIVSVALWALIELITWLAFRGPYGYGEYDSPLAAGIGRFLSGLQAVAYRLWVAGLAGLAILWLVRATRRLSPAADEPSNESATPP